MARVNPKLHKLLKIVKKYRDKKYCFHCKGYIYPEKDDKLCERLENCNPYIWVPSRLKVC